MSYSRSFLLIFILVLFSISVFAVDGVVLINQASVMAAGGFPYQINNSGSYKLSGNLNVPANTDGIDITVDNVTLDLNGFTIKGQIICVGQPVTSCTSGSGEGVNGAEFRNNITVRNGTIIGFTTGLDLTFGTSEIVEDIQASGNSDIGIFGGAGVVRHSTANGNLNYGIYCIFCVITQSTALYNGVGIGSFTSTIVENMISYNKSFGIAADQSTLYGSNTLVGNGTAVEPGSGTSQKNNLCNFALC